ncbi:MAG: hypothetical protein EBX52_12135 [Proteobacteria bacterium]|nr:hypothetical protein [Pseudomonadota bacterium]
MTLAGSLPWLRHPVFLLFSPKWSFRIEDEEKFREAMNVRGIETHSVKSLQWMVWAGLVLFVTSGMIDRIVEAWPSVSWALLFAGAGILWALRLGNAKLRIRKRPVNRVLRRLDWLIGACVLLSIGLFSASDRLWSKTDEHAAKARRLWKAHLEKEAIEPDEVIGAHLERKPSVSAYMETLACAEFGLGHQEQALHTAAGAYR